MDFGPLFDTARDKTLSDKFREYHLENPAVFEAFDRFTREAIAAGRKHIGAKLIFERIRWYTRVEARKTDGFKLNNNYHAFYARLWMALNPEYGDVFRLRRQRSKAE